MRDALARLRGRARAVLIGQRVAVLVGAVLLAAVLVGLIDFALRLPLGVRWVVWVGLVAWAVVGFVRWVLPAVRFRPSLTEVALRVERQHPEVAGLLASAVDFSLEDETWARQPAMTRAMALRVVDQAVTAFDVRRGGGSVRRSGLVQGGVWAGVALVVALAPALVVPALWWIGAQRVGMPWAGAEWPRRWEVESATAGGVHALGDVLALRAVVKRSSVGPESADVWVTYRVYDEDGDAMGAARRELLTWQQDAVDGDGGAVFERLIEPGGARLRYRFSAGDDDTGWESVDIVEPPAVLSALASIEPPGYVASIDGAGIGVSGVELGPGDDERAIAPTSLAGSSVELELVLNKEASIDPGLVEALVGEGVVEGSVRVEPGDGASDRYTVGFVLAGPVRMGLSLVDEHAIRSRGDIVYLFEGVVDAPASSAVTDPARDVTVLPTAVVEVTGEGRDDVGLGRVELERRVFEVPTGDGAGVGDAAPARISGGGTLVARGAGEVIAGVDGQRGLEARVTASVSLVELDVEPGDAVEVTALASDIYRDPSGAAREATRSPVRVLRVISRSEFVDEVWSELREVRQNAMRGEEEQRAARERVGERGADEQAMRGQAQVSERLAQQGEAIERVRERVEQNNLGDSGLNARLSEAADAAERAGEASARASEAMDEAQARREAEGDQEAGERGELTEEESQEVSDAQDQAQAEMERLIRVLDTGEDTWAVRNAIESMIERQAELREETGEAARQTAGREADELTPAERSELKRIVSEQEAMADELRELMDEMREREASLQRTDPASAQAVRDARQTAEQSGAEQMMEQAAQEAQENRMTQAGQQQEQAEEALEQMLDSLDQSEQERGEVLRRMLQTIMAQLRELIADQEVELAALGMGVERGDLGGLDLGMIQLHQATLAVLDGLKAAGPELAGIVGVVSRAGDAQANAVVSLRKAPVDDAGAQAQEERSLGLLNEALALAQELDQRLEQQEQQRKRRELRQAYGRMLERQVALRDEALGFAEAGELDRRDRARVRQLGEEQGAIRELLGELLEETDELSDAQVFEYTHRRLDGLTGEAGGLLDRGDASAAVAPASGAVVLLEGLVTALNEAQRDEPFDQQEGGGGGGQGGQNGQQQEEPLIPPIAQLKLLRALQADVAARTAVADEARSGVEGLGVEQGELHALGRAVLEALQQQQGGGAPPIDVGPDGAGGGGPDNGGGDEVGGPEGGEIDDAGE